MYDFNPDTRNVNIDQILDGYENILLETGVLTRLNKSFNNNKLINKDPIPTIIKNNYKSKQGQPLSKELNSFANLDPGRTFDVVSTGVTPTTNVVSIGVTPTKKCPVEKELNIKTNRCINKCKPNYSRNSKFKCVKNKTQLVKKKGISKSSLSKSYKNNKNRPRSYPRGISFDPIWLSSSEEKKRSTPLRNRPRSSKLVDGMRLCPSTKELNIKTNRCINKCKPNYIRNSKFKCVKNKTQPTTSGISKSSLSKSYKNNKNNSVKKCPSTKELNIKTNRCINKCKPNYSRNSKFKCVKNKN